MFDPIAFLHWEKREWDGTAWAEIAGTRGAAIPDATGGSVIYVEGRAAINAVLTLLRSKGVLGHMSYPSTRRHSATAAESPNVLEEHSAPLPIQLTRGSLTQMAKSFV